MKFRLSPYQKLASINSATLFLTKTSSVSSSVLLLLYFHLTKPFSPLYTVTYFHSPRKLSRIRISPELYPWRRQDRLSSLPLRASLMAQTVKNPPAIPENWVQSMAWEDPLEEGMAIYCSILSRESPWTEESGGLQSKGQSRAQLSDQSQPSTALPQTSTGQ